MFRERKRSLMSTQTALFSPVGVNTASEGRLRPLKKEEILIDHSSLSELDPGISIRELNRSSAPIPTDGPRVGAGKSKNFESGEEKCRVA
jgi:hypothetical protein